MEKGYGNWRESDETKRMTDRNAEKKETEKNNKNRQKNE